MVPDFDFTILVSLELIVPSRLMSKRAFAAVTGPPRAFTALMSAAFTPRLEVTSPGMNAMENDLNKKSGVLSDDDVTTLQTLAAQASIAIVNARLFQQSDMISEMVHELRTPLMSLSATTHLLTRSDLPDDKRAFLIKTMQSETGRLSQMTTDFLDMAKLEWGRMRFAKEPFDLPELLAECAEVVRPQAQARRGLTLTVQAKPEALTVENDRGKLKQVILNLLTNAVKYNRENGQITVTLEVTGPTCRVNVTDTGKGIPPDGHERVVKRRR